MKNFLGKAVATAGLVSLIATTANGAPDGQIIISGTVDSSVVVGFVDVSGEAAATNRFVGVDVALGAVLPGGTWAPVTNNIYVNTNHAGDVQLTITDSVAAAGVLKDTAAIGADIPVTYSLMGAAYTVDTTGAVTINTGANAGSVPVGTFIVTPAATAVDQAVGTYSATLNVTVSAI